MHGRITDRPARRQLALAITTLIPKPCVPRHMDQRSPPWSTWGRLTARRPVVLHGKESSSFALHFLQTPVKCCCYSPRQQILEMPDHPLLSAEWSQTHTYMVQVQCSITSMRRTRLGPHEFQNGDARMQDALDVSSVQPRALQLF